MRLPQLLMHGAVAGYVDVAMQCATLKSLSLAS
jgi:hypothetical protein